MTLLMVKMEEGLNKEEGGANGEEWTAEEKKEELELKMKVGIGFKMMKGSRERA